MADKDRERMYAETAARLLGYEWQLVEIPEPVDFEVRTPEARFGLEIRQVFADAETPFGSPAKRKENENQKISATLANLYISQGGRPATVKLLGNLCSVSKETLIRETIAHCPTEAGDRRRFQLEGLTVHLSALPHGHEPRTKWDYVNDRVGWLRDATNEELQHAIDHKIDRLPLYKQKYDRIELLLIADRMFNSGRMRVADKLEVSNPWFDAIYLLSYPDSAMRVA